MSSKLWLRAAQLKKRQVTMRLGEPEGEGMKGGDLSPKAELAKIAISVSVLLSKVADAVLKITLKNLKITFGSEDPTHTDTTKQRVLATVFCLTVCLSIDHHSVIVKRVDLDDLNEDGSQTEHVAI